MFERFRNSMFETKNSIILNLQNHTNSTQRTHATRHKKTVTNLLQYNMKPNKENYQSLANFWFDVRSKQGYVFFFVFGERESALRQQLVSITVSEFGKIRFHIMREIHPKHSMLLSTRQNLANV
jgi:GTP-dependent phosphoenolpyruvate carboxykinase